jgi:hypothetical protein
MIRRLVTSIQSRTMNRGAEFMAPYLEPGERITATDWCAPPDLTNEPALLVARQRARMARVLLTPAGCGVALLTLAVAVLSGDVLGGLRLALIFALIWIVLAGAVSFVANVFWWIYSAQNLVESVDAISQVRTRYAAGGYPSWYVALADRRFLMVGATAGRNSPFPTSCGSARSTGCT